MADDRRRRLTLVELTRRPLGLAAAEARREACVRSIVEY